MGRQLSLCEQSELPVVKVMNQKCHQLPAVESMLDVSLNTVSLLRFCLCTAIVCWCQWLRGLRCRSLASRLLRLWVCIPPQAWMFVCCKCCVLSGRGLCDGFIIHPEESYRLWCIVVCDQETSNTRRLKPTTGL